MEDVAPLTPRRLVLRGLTRRCPVCGSRGIFTGWFAMRDRCPRCNFPTTRVEDQWIGTFGLHVMATFTLVGLAVAVGFAVTYPDPPIGILMAITMSVAVVAPIAGYPLSRSTWSAIDLAMRPLDPDDDVDPRFLPPTGRPD